eukprot:XP_011666608.1 PREDICTED: uncharacterized protein LOC105439377 [Strongylocentrotus purpuratus]
MGDKKALIDKLSSFGDEMDAGCNRAIKLAKIWKEEFDMVLRDLLSQWDQRVKGVTKKQLEDDLVGAENATTKVVADTGVEAGDGAVHDTRRSDRSDSVHTHQGGCDPKSTIKIERTTETTKDGNKTTTTFTWSGIGKKELTFLGIALCAGVTLGVGLGVGFGMVYLMKATKKSE